jgi:hypothetical protein
MPQAGSVVMNGLNAWVMAVSGELSMTRVFPVAVPVFAAPGLELELELDEQAASPPASTPAAATAQSRL